MADGARRAGRLAGAVAGMNLLASGAALVLALPLGPGGGDAEVQGHDVVRSLGALADSLGAGGLDADGVTVGAGQVSGEVREQRVGFDLAAGGLVLSGPTDAMCGGRARVDLSSYGLRLCGRAL